MQAGKRNIQAGSQYEQYFDRSLLIGSDPIINPNGNNYDTLAQMEQIVKKTLNQTKRIAAKLKGRSMEESLRNLWTFLYTHVQYKLDSASREQLRTPIRTWKDRKSGVDCDCYSIFVSSVLKHWGYAHALRMAGYKADYQHVYVVVPKDGKTSSLTTQSEYYTVDPVVDQFNYEVSFNKKFDRAMGTQMLNGVENASCKRNSAQYKYFERTTKFLERGQVVTRVYLTENKIPFTVVDGDDTGFGYKVGNVIVPPIISPSQAEAIRLAYLNPVTENPTTTTPQTENKNTWVWWALAGLGFIVLSTQESPEKKETTEKKSNALSGVRSKRR